MQEDERSPSRWPWYIVVGVAEALLGGFLLSFYYETANGGKWFTFFAALLGSTILLSLIKLVRKQN
ncbi:MULTISPECIES: GlsB/YeaQ/YmgE family stress response membrane protein [unclassified Mycobacteroides]|uniref:GlsB/YeaQ/YmgE family stress response membrane protein n=1 Tax=unclassified Mycobacteroides TaxID=2618759 RepID=UPI00132303E0|nr:MULTISPECIES: GlsB/YeaQ/YmgE family stress response membrane protein [unclassified Mycobacteroides]MUM17654.1 hypothetical protein [Mycobacteroides sp. CBMA 326]